MRIFSLMARRSTKNATSYKNVSRILEVYEKGFAHSVHWSVEDLW